MDMKCPPEGLPEQPRVYIRTFGCQMNVYDTEKLYAFLADTYLPASGPEDADLILLNTCSIRGKAEQKVYSLLGRLRPLKEARPGLLIGVGGCVAQQEGQRILKKAPMVDIVFGTHNISEVPEIIEQRLRTGRSVCRIVEESGSVPTAKAPKSMLSSGPTALLTIMKGCDNFCAYCVVPLVRGREISRPSSEILHEALLLLEGGVREITLLGQNVNSYRDPDNGLSFVDLLEKMDSLAGLERIRFVTSHPKDLSRRLARALGDLPSLCEHIHLPFQAGSDRVLRAMNRGYTKSQYLEKVDLLRREVPQLELTTDIIVGFPGEERSDFEETLSLIETVRFQNAFSFRFSPRPGTAAHLLPDTLTPEDRRPWLPELQALQNSITAEKHRSMIGKSVQVLAEGRGRGNNGLLEARTRNNYIVHFPGRDDMIGKTFSVRITGSRTIHLEGEIEADRSEP